jgi:hypothetical protein
MSVPHRATSVVIVKTKRKNVGITPRDAAARSQEPQLKIILLVVAGTGVVGEVK